MTPDYPYRTDGVAALHPDGWASIPAASVAVAALTPTQPSVSIARIQHVVDGGEPETGDPYPHVVTHGGRLYVHDGHHRYVVALAIGQETLPCRVVDESGRHRPLVVDFELTERAR